MVTRDFRSIPQFPHVGGGCNYPWNHLGEHLQREKDEMGLDLSPRYQREHVWVPEQQRAYIEYCMSGGEVARTLVLTTTDRHGWPPPNYALLDGKQRLEAILAFMRGEMRVFPDASMPDGYALADFTGNFPFSKLHIVICVVECRTYADQLRLYLNINGGGTPHKPAELARVRAMLAEEEARDGT